MRARGFTLLELLVALAVIGLILALAMPDFHSIVAGRQLDTSARLLRDAMTEARSQAIARRAPATVTLDIQDKAFRVDGSSAWSALGDDLRIEFTTALTEVVAETRGRVRFYPDGTSTGAIVRLFDGEDGVRLNVDWLTGRARLNPLGENAP